MLLAGCSLLTDLGGLSGAGGDASIDSSVQGSIDSGLVDATVDADAPPGPPKWRLVATVGPPGRHSAGFAYDENRQRVVLFGGQAANKPYADTWEWDGAAWGERALAAGSSPGARRGHKMVWDTARKSIFLYGGTRGDDASDQWSWNGQQWTALASATHPSTLQPATMTFDESRGVAVLFGGFHFATGGAESKRDETWEWNGTDWLQRTPPQAPSARRGHAMAYDSARKRVVLFGGRGAPADTWEWDGTTWTVHAPPSSPPPALAAACMAFDPRRKVTVMHGGGTGDGNSSAKTWLWDGANWSAGPSGGPAVRSCAMAWDPVRRVVVLFSGAHDAPNDGPALSETWYFE